jgi:N-acetylmuramoyl-L-alanine amidase
MFYLVLFLFNAHCAEINFSDFDKFQFQTYKMKVKQRIRKYLQKDKGVESYYKIDRDSLKMLDTDGELEYELLFKKTEKEIPSPLKRLPKIAIDPGHLGGKYALLEGRFFHQLPHERNNNRDDLVVKEGNINFYTAQVLKEKLEEIGVEVLMTRKNIGLSSFDMTYEQWLEQKYSDYVEKYLNEEYEGEDKDNERKKMFALKYEQKFSYFAKEDFYNRFKMINEFNPDVAISVHYNSCGRKIENSRYMAPKQNISMVFVAGSFEGGDMKRPTSRYHFLRLLLTDHIEKAAKLGSHMADEFVNRLKVPLVDNYSQYAPYIKRNSLFISPGVYARALGFVREVKAPAVLTEPLCADDPSEGLLLDDKIVTKDSKRIQQVAESYFQAIRKTYDI